MKVRLPLVSLAVLSFSLPAFAWGPNGHRVVGRIAERHLTPQAAAAVKALLGQDTLAEIATWGDDIRSDPKWKKADPWHYVTIEDNETYETSRKNPAGDVIEAIRRYEGVLRNRQSSSREDQIVALKFLVHFVGDIHMPLHVGRGNDRGGNEIQVNWFRGQMNLHAVWDYAILDNERLSFSEIVEFLDEPSAAEIARWRNSGVLDWAMESFRARSSVYDIGDGKLGFDYAYKHLPLVKLRLMQAGIRLSGLLNSIFP